MGGSFTGWSGPGSDAELNITISPDALNYEGALYEDSLFSDIPIVGPIIDWLEAQLTALYNWLLSQLSWVIDQIRSAVQAVLNVVLWPITTAINWAKDKLLDVYYWLSSTIPAAIEAIRVKLLDVWSWITKTIPNALDWIKDRISSLLTRVADIIPAITSAADNIIKSISRVLSSFFDPVCNQLNAIFKSLRPDLEASLQYNTPEVREKILSLWPRGTVLWDYVKSIARVIFWVPWTFADIVRVLWSGFVKNDWTPAINRVNEDMAAMQKAQASLPEFIKSEIADPILDGIKHLFENLANIFKAAFDAIWGAIKEFFTVILPGWFKSLWDALHRAVSWIWDKVTDVASSFLEEILKLVGIHSPITPEGGLGTLKGMVKVGIALAGGLGLMTLLGNMVHPLHSMGLEHISAMIYDMTNYKLLIGAGMGVIAATSIRTPLTWYFNSLLRPNIPSERDVAEMYNRELISGGLYSEYLSYRGYPNLWHEPLKRLTETPLRYFGLAAVSRTGYFDREFVKTDLIRGGYAPDTRNVLLAMFQKLASESLKGMMSGTAIKRFKEGMTTEAQFHAELTLLGHTDQQFPQYLAAAKMDYAYDYTSDLISAYRDAVRKGNISMDQYRQALLDLSIVPERVEAYVLRERARLKPTEKLTPLSPATPAYETDAGKIQVDTLRRQRRKLTISRDQEIAGLLQLGMPTDYATAIANNDDIRLAEKATGE